jgi:uncharacterized protein YlaI
MEKCLICSSTKNLQSHEIHGKNHRPIPSKRIRDSEYSFVPLCSKCHNRLHKLGMVKIGLSKELTLKWIEAFKLIYKEW